MSAIKLRRATVGIGGVTASRLTGTLPDRLVARLASRDLAVVLQLPEATYRDGYTAAGGDTCDTVTHCERFRSHLRERLNDD